MPKRILIAGESWVTHSIHQKGFDSFTTTEYVEGVGWLRDALEAYGWTVEHQPAHVAARSFPRTPEALAAYDVVLLSDIGSNTLLLHPDTLVRSVSLPNALEALRTWVAGGGGLVMVGGYMTFQGIDGKARYAGSPLEDVLPVTLRRTDDRVEAPQGLIPEVVDPNHPIAAGLPKTWPALLGLNELSVDPGGSLVATAGGYPLVVAGRHERGRAVAFASDCGPHWAPPAFCDWEHYARLWHQIALWASGGV
ncbi:MAG: cytoplasmic protein [Alphaproteobacteria bacterium]|nr:cytoplasmic protein [Alphaproteobacteria bacterium]MCB9696261.1 cytoplasmic protein [Alphaproteobacteria bacterium]